LDNNFILITGAPLLHLPDDLSELAHRDHERRRGSILLPVRVDLECLVVIPDSVAPVKLGFMQAECYADVPRNDVALAINAKAREHVTVKHLHDFLPFMSARSQDVAFPLQRFSPPAPKV
jgi:hypothetical protein